MPHALTTEEAVAVKAEFVAAARRAVDAGLDGVEVHGANGHLLHEFLAVDANTRTDVYGGSPEARARFVVEVVTEVAAEIGAGRVGLRISPSTACRAWSSPTPTTPAPPTAPWWTPWRRWAWPTCPCCTPTRPVSWSRTCGGDSAAR
ncbi:hypothetical protein ACFQX8_01515 [Klenkia terrae]|uniref:oxidoreductase n=1 Tax=Klenkia terrae TaxID=1052259 RepID=UPI00360BD940